ncbi:hypothetical protein [Crateriforma conspicua]|uniref:Uncharacterized protein n=1 Tax=Crateriforma conspicua TaxID=2527996 RepID=A0A5C6FMS2_9PLAN|nr:hypothetical protein [Crateriforma conspicua]TWU61918.1 hypothetical protein V7x_36080 [Crateriforma conspicua]
MFRIQSIVAALIVVASMTTANAQTSDTQKFTVTVPSSIAIIAPDNVNLIHDESENDQSFLPQSWIVKGNSSAGVTATFATAAAFTHTNTPSEKRDVALGLAVGSSIGGATWTVAQSSDQTDYVNNDEVATVQVSSDGFGTANMDLSVTFITDGFGTFLAGDYETIVTGTITSN